MVVVVNYKQLQLYQYQEYVRHLSFEIYNGQELHLAPQKRFLIYNCSRRYNQRVLREICSQLFKQGIVYAGGTQNGGWDFRLMIWDHNEMCFRVVEICGFRVIQCTNNVFVTFVNNSYCNLIRLCQFNNEHETAGRERATVVKITFQFNFHINLNSYQHFC